MSESSLNIADRLRRSAELVPDQKAVIFPESRDQFGRVAYTHLTFRQLDDLADTIARGLLTIGVQPQDRLVLMVRPSLEFIALTFGIFRSGAICTLIDPGMGRRRIMSCLEETEPTGFVAIPIVHAIRKMNGRRFPGATKNVVVGTGVMAQGGMRYTDLLEAGRRSEAPLPSTEASDPAAIIFTSGSTGPPKGVLYEHGMFDAQVDLIRDQYGIQPGEIDLPGFPLFALFNLAMQVTTVIPDMDPTKPAEVNPERILESYENQNVTQAYGSPALWDRVSRYCTKRALRLPRLNRVLSAGAPVPHSVVRRMVSLLEKEADIHTPYGATECLPVATISGREILEETAEATASGAGTCVGHLFAGMEVRIIPTTDGPISELAGIKACPQGEIGEIIVRGPVATREYFRRADATSAAKIPDGDTFWHRMGDVGYFDDRGRLWFCGRKAHIVHRQQGPLYAVRCEPIFNQHPEVHRTAVVGIGAKGDQLPVLIVEPEVGSFPRGRSAETTLFAQLAEIGAASELTTDIRRFLLIKALPVDTRHNVKINREALADWAAERTPWLAPDAV